MVSEKVSVSVSKNVGIEKVSVSVSKKIILEKMWYRKNYWFRYKKKWYRKKVSDSVLFIFSVLTHTAANTDICWVTSGPLAKISILALT